MLQEHLEAGQALASQLQEHVRVKSSDKGDLLEHRFKQSQVQKQPRVAKPLQVKREHFPQPLRLQQLGPFPKLIYRSLSDLLASKLNVRSMILEPTIKSKSEIDSIKK